MDIYINSTTNIYIKAIKLMEKTVHLRKQLIGQASIPYAQVLIFFDNI